MISIAKIVSTLLANGRRKIKAIVFGLTDVRECYEAAPYGIDSNPVANIDGVYVQTSSNGNSVIVGYVTNNRKADTGEFRAYSTDSSGAFKYNIWLRSSGEVLIGESDTPSAYTENLIKYNAFNTIMQSYLTTLNAAISAGVSSGGGAYTPPTAPNFTTAKTDKIKTI